MDSNVSNYLSIRRAACFVLLEEFKKILPKNKYHLDPNNYDTALFIHRERQVVKGYLNAIYFLCEQAVEKDPSLKKIGWAPFDYVTEQYRKAMPILDAEEMINDEGKTAVEDLISRLNTFVLDLA